MNIKYLIKNPFSKIFDIKNFKLVALLCFMFFLNSCFSKTPLPPCPGVYLEKDTVSGIFFKDDIGKDITDRMLEVEITDYSGFCAFSKDLKKVEVTVQVCFDVTLGGAVSDRNTSFDYFVAIPSFFPAKEGKQVFKVDVTFPEGIYYVRHRDNEIKITLPMPQSKEDKDLSIFVGLQLTKNQLEYNRKIINSN